jgi:hypothetical protein
VTPPSTFRGAEGKADHHKLEVVMSLPSPTRLSGGSTLFIAILWMLGGSPSSAHAQSMLGEPPDRTEYTAEQSVNVTKPDSVCGFDANGGLPAMYHREHRHYVQWENGRPMRDWEGQIDLFDHCVGHMDDRALRPFPDGISFTVPEATEYQRPDSANCGGSMAIYRRESRQYAERANGELLRSWRATVDGFNRCDES